MPNRQRLAAILVLAAFLASGCATVTSGDPVVVRSEQSVNIAFDTVDTFLYIEKNHPLGADVHAVAEKIRDKGPDAFRKARRLIDVYKGARTDENRADMMTALAFVSALADEVRPYLVQYEAAKGGQ